MPASKWKWYDKLWEAALMAFFSATVWGMARTNIPLGIASGVFFLLLECVKIREAISKLTPSTEVRNEA